MKFKGIAALRWRKCWSAIRGAMHCERRQKLGRTDQTFPKALNRVMNRVRALNRPGSLPHLRLGERLPPRAARHDIAAVLSRQRYSTGIARLPFHYRWTVDCRPSLAGAVPFVPLLPSSARHRPAPVWEESPHSFPAASGSWCRLQ